MYHLCSVWNGTEEECQELGSEVCVLQCADQQAVICKLADIQLSKIPLLHSLVSENGEESTLTVIPLHCLATRAQTLRLCLMYASGQAAHSLFEGLAVPDLIDVAKTADSLLMVRLMVDVCSYLLSRDIPFKHSDKVPLSVYALLVALQPSIAQSIISADVLTKEAVEGADFRLLVSTHAENARERCPGWFSLWIRADEPGWPVEDAAVALTMQNVDRYTHCATRLLLGRGLLLDEQLWLYTLIYNTMAGPTRQRGDDCIACFKEAIQRLLSAPRPDFMRAASKLCACFRYLEVYHLVDDDATLMQMATSFFDAKYAFS